MIVSRIGGDGRIVVKAEPGQMVTPNVRLKTPLGEGGMGSVWLADHLALHTEVVVKFMSEELAESVDAVARFSREAAAASQVKSPHVVQMLDHGVMEGGAPYIVMEHLDGKDLAAHLDQRGRLEAREATSVVQQLARALDKAHERGIVHRDIKPPNVFLLDAGGGEVFVKLLDFGIAKSADLTSLGSTTRTGAVVGSPYYMSPEQVVGAKDIDFHTDLWSLGVMTYEMLTGEKPFYADTIGALALKIHHDPLPRPTVKNTRLAPGIDAWFEKACAREPAARFASARAMAEALAVALSGEPVGPVVSVVPSGRTAAAALAHTAMATASDLDAGSLGVTSKKRSPLPIAVVVGALSLGAVTAIAMAVRSSTASVAPESMQSATSAVSTPTPPPIESATPPFASAPGGASGAASAEPPASAPIAAPPPASAAAAAHVKKPKPQGVTATAVAAPSASAKKPPAGEDDIR